MVVAERSLTDARNKGVPNLDEIVTIIRMNGGLFLKPKNTPEEILRPSPLSPREMEILEYMYPVDTLINRYLAGSISVSTPLKTTLLQSCRSSMPGIGHTP